MSLYFGKDIIFSEVTNQANPQMNIKLEELPRSIRTFTSSSWSELAAKCKRVSPLPFQASKLVIELVLRESHLTVDICFSMLGKNGKGSDLPIIMLAIVTPLNLASVLLNLLTGMEPDNRLSQCTLYKNWIKKRKKIKKRKDEQDRNKE